MSDLAISGAINNSNSLDTRTLKDQVVRLLRQAILSGKISAGGRLNESQLARELGVSRVPIREALQPLELQGLVVDVPRRGKFVISLSDEEIQKINSLRLILEAEALRLCRAKINSGGVNSLNQLVEKMQRSGGIPEIEAAALIWSSIAQFGDTAETSISQKLSKASPCRSSLTASFGASIRKCSTGRRSFPTTTNCSWILWRTAHRTQQKKSC